jgi:hypothetical protein
VYGAGTYFPGIFTNRYPHVAEFPDDLALNQLAAWDVKYILVDVKHLNDPATTFTLADIDAQPRLRHVVTLDSQAVYELLPAAADNGR